MRGSKAGMITVVIVILLMIAVVTVDYINDCANRYPYDHGDIESIAMVESYGSAGGRRKFSAYRDDGEYKLSLEYMGEKQVIILSRQDWDMLTEAGFKAHQSLSYYGSCFPARRYLFRFEDSEIREVITYDQTIGAFFDDCAEGYLEGSV